MNEAILSGDADAVLDSIGRGAGVNKPLNVALPLTTAKLNGEEDVALCLIDHGADISLDPLDDEESGNGVPESDFTATWLDVFLVMLSKICYQFAVHEIWLQVLGLMSGRSGRCNCYLLHRRFLASLYANRSRNIHSHFATRISRTTCDMNYSGFHVLYPVCTNNSVLF